MKKKSIFSRFAAVAAIPAFCLGSAHAAVVVAGLDTPAVESTGTAGGSLTPTINGSQGMTVNLTFTPQSADLSGTVLLAEIGGTSNGTGIYLINGQVVVSSRSGYAEGSGDYGIPDSTDDPVGPAWAVSHSAALAAGTEYSLGVILNGGTASLVQIGLATTGAVDAQDFAIISGGSNWYGNNTFSVKTNDNTVGFRGGLTLAPDEVTFSAAGAQDFAGDITAAFWNATATGFQPVPEPGCCLLAAMGGLLLARRRR